MENYYENCDVLEVDGQKDLMRPDILGNLGLLKVYAPWCGHCKNMKDTMKQIAHNLNDVNYNVMAINSENDNNKELIEKLSVRGFPSLFTIDRNGSPTEYTGNRDKLSLLNKICEQTEQGVCCEMEGNDIKCNFDKKSKKSPKRKSPKRKSPKRKSPKRKSPKSKSIKSKKRNLKNRSQKGGLRKSRIKKYIY